MRKIILMIVAVALVGCGSTPEPTKITAIGLIANPIVEKAIRKELKKARLEAYIAEAALTNADLDSVTSLDLYGIKDAGLKDVAKCKNLTLLFLYNTKITDEGLKDVAKMKQLYLVAVLAGSKVTKAGMAELLKALPECEIRHGNKIIQKSPNRRSSFAPNPPHENP